MKIRKLSYRDFNSLFELINEIYDENPSATWFAQKPSMEEVEALLGYKLAKLKDKDAVDYVALENDTVVGECEIIKDESNNGWLGIIVKKGFRGRGLGSTLLKKCIPEAKRLGIENIFAEVASTNSAIEFFKKNGFEIKSLEDREDKHIVLLQLKKE
ncbi:MAG: GNAT family N-acetyltransferase [Candidatus Micrarchaeota archaeon]